MTTKKRKSPEKNKGDDGRQKKRIRTGSSAATQRPTAVERPSRRKKPAERFLSTLSPSKAQRPASSTLSFGQGSGTELQDVPSVYLKLAKHKIDEKLQVLHTILYGRRTKAYTLKANILKFSGFLWGEKKAKLRAKETLEKCNKEILLYFCKILDIGHVKASTRKEEISAKLMDFLESPCITIDVIPSVKEAKRRATIKKMLDKCNKEILLDFCEILDIEYGKTSIKKDEISTKLIEILESHVTTDVIPAAKERQRKSQKQLVLDEDKSEDRFDSDDPRETSSDNRHERNCESEQEEEDSDEGDPAETVKRSKGNETEEVARTPKVKKNVSASKGSCRLYSRRGSTSKKVVGKDEPSRPKVSKRSSKDLRNASGIEDVMTYSSDEKSKSSEKQYNETQNSTKERGNVNSVEDLSNGLSTSDLHAAISEIIKRVDLDTATLSDIVEQLEGHFKVDLTDRREEVKRLVEDEMLKIIADEDDEEGDDEVEDDVGEDGATQEDSDGDSDGV